MDLVIEKYNEVFIRIRCDEGIAQELHEYFSFFVPNFQFSPQFKKKLWNGKIYLYNSKTQLLYHGLIPYVEKFCQDRHYTYHLDTLVRLTENWSLEEAKQFIHSLDLPEQIQLRDYQFDTMIHAIRNRRQLIVSPTGSGKSLVLYCLVRYFLYRELNKVLIIVPTTSLVEQLTADFQLYGWDTDQYIHKQYHGKDKTTTKPVLITTWQSIYELPKSYFEQFDAVLGDECVHPDTLITMADGTTKPIKNISIGDEVLTYNESTQQTESKPVLKVHKNLSISEIMYEVSLNNGTQLKITGNHKVLLKSGLWKRVDELEVGDIINSIE